MKKICLLILLSVLLLGLIACSNQKSSEEKQNSNTTTVKPKDNKQTITENATNKDVREIVWEQLKENEKEYIKGSWSEGTLTKLTLTNSMGRIENNSYIGKEVYLVDFPSKNIGRPNNYGVFADKYSGKIIGYGYAD